jgi:restriction system protein
MDQQKAMFGIRAGSSSEADQLFLEQNKIALGFPELGDLNKLPADREGFRERFAQIHPDDSPARVRALYGQPYRFVHELQTGDYVVYISKVDSNIHIGEVKSPYVYAPQVDESFPHQREVEWLAKAPRTRLSAAARREIGSIIAFFKIQYYTNEYLEILRGQRPQEPSEQQAVAYDADEIEIETETFIISTLASKLKGYPFQEFVANLLEAIGYTVNLRGKGADRGIDITAHNDEFGFSEGVIKVQVKSTESDVGDPEIARLAGKMAANEYGLFVSLGGFTKQARMYEDSRPNLVLIGGKELVTLILKYYDKLDPQYRNLIPLKQVYVPIDSQTVNEEQ